MLKISHIQAYSDNYIWLIQTNEGNTLVDPGDASPVLDFIQREEIEIDDILITHHHFDHVGGLQSLKPLIKGSIIGPESKNIDKLDYKVKDGELITTIGLEFSVIEIPGHTLDHIAFYSNTEKEVLFCGDTIFSGGCGRVFEGTHEEMFHSLNKIKNLPPDTKIYCGHEYTNSNLNFCLEHDPKNTHLKDKKIDIEKKLNSNQPTIPSTIADEIKTNIFLRCDDPEIKQGLGLKDSSDVEVFSKLRDLKDSF